MADAQPETLDVKTAHIRRRMFVAFACVLLGAFAITGACV